MSGIAGDLVDGDDFGEGFVLEVDGAVHGVDGAGDGGAGVDGEGWGAGDDNILQTITSTQLSIPCPTSHSSILLSNRRHPPTL